jgi:hypothetical protein
MSFNPDEYIGQTQPAFNPDDYLATKTVPVVPGKLESLARGIAQGGTAMFADEIGAAMRSNPMVGLPAGGGVPSSFMGQDFAAKAEAMPENYQRNLEKERGDYDRAQAANPITSFAGNIAGSVASIPASGIKGAAALGALGGLGGATGDVSNQALQAGIGGVLGGAGQAVIGGLSPSILKHFAEKRAAESVKMTPTMMMKLEKAGIPKEELGRFMLDENIVKPFSSAEDIAGGFEQAGQKYGQKIGDVIKTAEESGAGKVPLRGIAEDVAAKYQPQLESKLPSLRTRAEKLMAELEDLRGGQVQKSDFPTISEAQQLKSDLGKDIDWSSNDPRKDIYFGLKEAIGSSIEEATGGGEAMQGALKGYKITQEMMPRAEYAAGKESMREGLGLKEILATQAGTEAGGSGVYGLASGAAMAGYRKYGRTVGAVGADQLSKGMGDIQQKYPRIANELSQAAQRGQKAVTIYDYIANQTDPEYRQMKAEMEKDQ